LEPGRGRYIIPYRITQKLRKKLRKTEVIDILTPNGIGKTIAYEELADMADKGLIEMIDKGRGVYYNLRT
jgi:ABC-type lipopolysaccharide export system ATPase subunit